jgi:hypothetical protein
LTLRKWYLDSISLSGDAAVVYAGRVSAGAFHVPYFELMTTHATRPAARLRRLSSRPRVTAAGRGVSLDAAALGITGQWTSAHAAIHVRLLDDERGRIVWRCHQPGGRADVQLPDGSILSGLGYAEELEMNVAPWAMPFDELRWGRFVGERQSVVWIDWRGGLDRRWVFVDGASVGAAVVEDDRIEWPGGAVEITAGRVLREGPVGKTVAGALAACLPRRVRQAAETKWVSRGLLRDDRTGSDNGWVIHELVRWGPRP